MIDAWISFMWPNTSAAVLLLYPYCKTRTNFLILFYLQIWHCFLFSWCWSCLLGVKRLVSHRMLTNQLTLNYSLLFYIAKF